MVCSCPIPVVTTRSISSCKQGRRCLSLPASSSSSLCTGLAWAARWLRRWTWSWSWRSSSEKRSPTPFLAASLELCCDWQWKGPVGAEPALLRKVTQPDPHLQVRGRQGGFRGGSAPCAPGPGVTEGARPPCAPQHSLPSSSPHVGAKWVSIQLPSHSLGLSSVSTAGCF